MTEGLSSNPRVYHSLSNKADMCTNSAVMEELVCLSSKWDILKASGPSGGEEGDGMSRTEREKWFRYGFTVSLEDSRGQMAGSGGTLLLIM